MLPHDHTSDASQDTEINLGHYYRVTFGREELIESYDLERSPLCIEFEAFTRCER